MMETNQIITTKTFVELFNIILTENKDASRKVAREVRKLLYSSRDGGKYETISLIIENAPNEYVKISEDWRQENFVVSVSVLYFLHNKENQPDFLFPWIIHLLQHQKGNIRQAARRMLENELGPLTVHIRCPNFKQGKIKSEQSDYILLNLFLSLNNLLAALWNPVYKKYKYVSSLPTSPYKTIQMVLGKMKNNCGKAYMDHLESQLFKPLEQ